MAVIPVESILNHILHLRLTPNSPHPVPCSSLRTHTHTHTHTIRSATNQYLIKYNINDTKVQKEWTDKKQFKCQSANQIEFCPVFQKIWGNGLNTVQDEETTRANVLKSCLWSGNRTVRKLGGKVTKDLKSDWLRFKYNTSFLDYWHSFIHLLTRSTNNYCVPSCQFLCGFFKFLPAFWFPHLDNKHKNIFRGSRRA